MLEDTLKLDYAGIICLEKETETEYIRRGNNVLRKADEIKDDFDLVYQQTAKRPKKRVEFPAVVSENMKQLFSIDNSWVPVYNMKYKFNTYGYCSSVYSDKIKVPVIFYRGTFIGKYGTMQHEAIHAVRKFVPYLRFKGFEEAFAEYTELALWPKKFMPSLAIRKARKNLEDKFGDKAGHVLIRLLPPEIYAIASSKEPERLLKDWGCMRHKIIRERLGL
ncbi:MAG: hypothetical protein WC852_01810 [Candidatus Nanoarchaeia archaeon]|jgi:hypothetical protein